MKLTDFGLARVAVDNVELTSHDHTVGTPAYMAPEQVLGESIDSRADLFALGCVVYAMLTGHSPFHGRTSLQIARKVTDWSPPPLTESHPAVPDFLSEIVTKLLEKKADDRYQSAMEVAELMNDHPGMINQAPTDKLKSIAAGAMKWPEPATAKASQAAAPRRWKFKLLAVFAMLVVVAGIALSFSGWPPAIPGSRGINPLTRNPRAGVVPPPSPERPTDEIKVSSSPRID